MTHGTSTYLWPPATCFSRRRALALLGAMPLLAFAGAGHAAVAPQKIAFIGAGRMANAIGTLLVKAGHDVMFSSRHPEEIKSMVDGLGAHAHAGTVAEAVKYGDVVFLTIPYNGVPDLAREFGTALAAKPLIVDVSNPIPRRDGEAGTQAAEEGAGVYLTHLIPGAKVVRAFNAINWQKLPEYAKRSGEKVAVPMVGDDRRAVALAETLVREIGFEPVTIGGLDRSKDTVPGTPLADDHSAAEVRRIAAEMKK